MGKAEILVVKEGVLMLKEEVFMEVNVVKDVVKFVAENSITKAAFTKAVMDSIVAHPIVIGTMC